MRDTFHRYLMTLGLGTAIAVLPYMRPASAESGSAPAAGPLPPPQDSAQTGLPGSEPVSLEPVKQTIEPEVLLPRIDLQQVPRTRVTPALDPAETPLPLEADAVNTQLQQPETEPLEAEGEPLAPTVTGQPTTISPTSSALDPEANPLLLPTRPGEVRITEAQAITLEQAIELSARNNQELQIALLELERSQAALREAQADRLPGVNLSASLTAQ
ncbi:MAG: TolC family protein, partial [Cyanobacteria bacterium Co-bin8]|nr:TolC family protein [Cyanobacteria bacterium Co-bin8]